MALLQRTGRLTATCSSSAQADAALSCALQAATQVLATWPRSRAHLERRHVAARSVALHNLLSLAPAVGFSLGECLALARAAVGARNVCAFVLLYKHLPQLKEAADPWAAAEVLCMLEQTLKTGGEGTCGVESFTNPFP